MVCLLFSDCGCFKLKEQNKTEQSKVLVSTSRSSKTGREEYKQSKCKLWGWLIVPEMDRDFSRCRKKSHLCPLEPWHFSKSRQTAASWNCLQTKRGQCRIVLFSFFFRKINRVSSQSNNAQNCISFQMDANSKWKWTRHGVHKVCFGQVTTIASFLFEAQNSPVCTMSNRGAECHLSGWLAKEAATFPFQKSPLGFA